MKVRRAVDDYRVANNLQNEFREAGNQPQIGIGPAMESRSHRVLVISNDADKVVGYAIVGIDGAVLELIEIYVGKSYRSPAIAKSQEAVSFGKALMEAVFDLAKAEHCSDIITSSHRNNVGAINLFGQFGFERVGMRGDFIEWRVMPTA